MKQKEISHPSLIRLFVDVQEKISCFSSEKGTYNRQDPTAFEKGKMAFFLNGEKFAIEFFDCSWGVEYTIRKYYPHRLWYVDGKNENDEVAKYFHSKEIGGFYLNRSFCGSKCTIIYRRKNHGILMLIRKLISQIEIPEKNDSTENDEEVWIDPVGGFHYGFESDPAKMYE